MLRQAADSRKKTGKTILSPRRQYSNMAVPLPVFLLIVLILIADVLLIIGIISAAVVLISSFVLGLSMRVVERKIEQYLQDKLREKGLQKVIYWVIHLSFGFLQVSKGLLSVFSAVVYILLGTVALVAINTLLAWLIYAYVL
jgi:hypothetical protein